MSEDFCDEMFRYCEDNTYIIVIVLLSRCLLPTRATSLFYSDFDHRLQRQHDPYATLLYIVDWLVQWSKDYSDTTVFG